MPGGPFPIRPTHVFSHHYMYVCLCVVCDVCVRVVHYYFTMELCLLSTPRKTGIVSVLNLRNPNINCGRGPDGRPVSLRFALWPGCGNQVTRENLSEPKFGWFLKRMSLA